MGYIYHRTPPFVMSFTEYDPNSKKPLDWTLYENVNPYQDLSLIPKDFMGKWGKRFAWGIGCKYPCSTNDIYCKA
jgi:hypothetical protein